MSLQIVITTFNRSGYLAGLLQSIGTLSPAPDGVIVVDNASTDDTAEVIAAAAARLAVPLIHHRLPENVGGSGGFSVGVQRALDEGAEWLWLMDDDVEVLPDALASFAPWMREYLCIHGRRYDEQGRPFFWQHHFNPLLGVYFPVRGDVFASSDTFFTNVGCFEGMLVNARAVREAGLPDPRFFLSWDDAIYGWVISRRHPVAYVNKYVLRKARPQKQISLGIRHLNDSSDLSRFYVMRNRGYVAQYLKQYHRFRPAGFAVGTVLTFGKEVLRLVAVEHRISGVQQLWRGWREARRLLRETWEPMPSLPAPMNGRQGPAQT